MTRLRASDMPKTAIAEPQEASPEEEVAADPASHTHERERIMIALDAHEGTLELEVDYETLLARAPAAAPAASGTVGRRIFAGHRARVGTAETGASVLFPE